jgi:hypothetical protein
LQTNLWIFPHPLNLFAEGGKDVDAIRLVRKRNWHHIRLIVQRTSQPADRYSLQELAAFLLGYGNDSHDRISPDAAASLDYGVLSPEVSTSLFCSNELDHPGLLSHRKIGLQTQAPLFL